MLTARLSDAQRDDKQVGSQAKERNADQRKDCLSVNKCGGVLYITYSTRRHCKVLQKCFLSTGDPSALGNYALLDVIQALLWLKENIPSFNGDPQRVTLFGHGTGAAIVNLLLLSPFVYGERDYRGNIFQRAIIQSGSATSTWAVSYDPKWCTEKLAIKVNCSRHIANTQALVHCLRERSDSTLVNSAPEAPKYYSCFAPSIDSWTVLPSEVEKLLKEPNSKFSTIPVMFGVTKNEAYGYLKQDDLRKGISNSRKAQIIRTYVQNVFRYHRQKIYAILDHHYTDWTRPPDPKSNRDMILELLSDGQFVAPLIQMANVHAETADTYLYSFAYSTQSETRHDNDEDVQGIHGDELPYIFGAPIVDGLSPFPNTYTAAEKMLSEAMMTYWTNFAKTGNPNEPRNQTSVYGEKISNRFVDLKWPKYTKAKQEYLPFGRRPTIRSHYRALKMAAWLDLIPKIDRNDGGDQSSHLLEQSDNMSTFDDSHHLIPNFDSIFPSPPPMPPVRPTPLHNNDATWTTHYQDFTDEGHTPRDGKRAPPTHQEDQSRGQPNHGEAANLGETTAEPAKISSYKGGAGAGVPLSIVVAIGGSLLLINLIIFAALCYQRERIRKMRLLTKPLAVPDLDIDDLRMSRKLESNRSSPCPMSGSGAAPECISLMSGASAAHQHATSPMKHPQGNTHVHNPSPQPSLHSRRGQSQLRATPPLEPVVCNYTAVPTQVTSPAHRTHVGVSQTGMSMAPSDRGGGMNTYVNSKVRSPLDSNHKADSAGPPPPAIGILGGGVSTFTSGARVGPTMPMPAPSVPNSQAAATGSGGHPHPPSSSGDDPLYKTINKTGQNNAVTIV
ncbi:Neuroligin-2 [Bulinus truncatus]|nr:Neuroligin-2 [Bulinus truncatus]